MVLKKGERKKGWHVEGRKETWSPMVGQRMSNKKNLLLVELGRV